MSAAISIGIVTYSIVGIITAIWIGRQIGRNARWRPATERHGECPNCANPPHEGACKRKQPPAKRCPHCCSDLIERGIVIPGELCPSCKARGPWPDDKFQPPSKQKLPSGAISGFGFPGQTGERRPHKIGCDEFHEHHAPKCCALDCWCCSGAMTLEQARKEAHGLYVSLAPHFKHEGLCQTNMLYEAVLRIDHAAYRRALEYLLEHRLVTEVSEDRCYVPRAAIERRLEELK